MLNPDLTPANVNKRAASGAFDLAAIALLSIAYFLVPVLTRGMVLPMWGVLLAVIGYSVVPLATFRQTLGMKLFGTELISKTGHALDIANLLFRELLGRGLFPAAFLFTGVMSVVVQYLGLARTGMPGGFFALFFVLCGFAFMGSLLGHFFLISDKQGRSFADVLSNSYVVPARAAATPTDADEAAELKAERARKVRGVVIAELVMLAVAFGLPWVLTTRHESTGQHAERLMREKLEAQFKANPDDEQVARDLARAYAATGEREKAIEMSAKLDGVRDRKQVQRAQQIRERFEKEPANEQAFMGVLEQLEGEDPVAAKAAYERFLAAHGADSSYRAGYADWLQEHGFADDAVTQMRAVVAEDPTFPAVHTYLAEALLHAENLEEAQLEFTRALLIDPADEDAIGALEELDAHLGPLPKAKKAALEKEYKAALAKAAK